MKNMHTTETKKDNCIERRLNIILIMIPIILIISMFIANQDDNWITDYKIQYIVFFLSASLISLAIYESNKFLKSLVNKNN